MSFTVNRAHFVPFRIGTVASPTTGLTIASFAVVFTRDNANITALSQTLHVVENGSGRYCAIYTPIAAGFYYLELYHAGTTTLITDKAEIDTSDLDNYVALTQDFGGTGALIPDVTNPENYTVYVFYSKDWQAGKTDNTFAIASTPLDSNGNWLSTPLGVTNDIYHIVAKDSTGDVVVVRAFLNTTNLFN